MTIPLIIQDKAIFNLFQNYRSTVCKFIFTIECIDDPIITKYQIFGS